MWLLKRQTGVILAYLTTVDSDVTRHAFVAPPEKPADEPRATFGATSGDTAPLLELVDAAFPMLCRV